MALFSRLLKLHRNNIPLEDFLTEIVAYLFSQSHTLLYSWLEYIDLLDTKNYISARVSTQVKFDRLEDHHAGSRPDILIKLSDGTYHDIIFIESKVGSKEGADQLARYAELLATNQSSGYRHKIRFPLELSALSRHVGITFTNFYKANPKICLLMKQLLLCRRME